MNFIKKTIVILSLVISATCFFDIRQFGAIPNTDTIEVQFKNKQAIEKAFISANKSQNQRTVRIPANMTFYSMPTRIINIKNIRLQVQGKLSASKNVLSWPVQPGSDRFEDFIHIIGGQNITITGGGKIDGRGYHWWLICILNDQKYLPNQAARPHLIHVQQIDSFLMHDITLKNSAQFHVKADAVHNSRYFNIDIKVNTTAQFNLLKKFSLIGVLPLFPLNTDGIDPAGANATFFNITSQNFDDVIVPKPSDGSYWRSNCTQNMHIQNCTVRFGIGMTIGSVPPTIDTNCIRNITFRNVQMHRPIKSIYIKSNPGDRGDGIIENIWYENFTMNKPIWWTIYIGPQQMKEPDGDGPGCMLYPLGPCQTQPRVTMRNITLKDIAIHNSLLFPVILRCNESNPCHDFNFINVKTNKWRIGQKKTGYICEHVSGKCQNCHPNIACLSGKDASKQQQQKEIENLRLQREVFDEDEEKMSLQTFNLILKELQEGVKQIGYDEEDDQFDYQLNSVTSENYKFNAILDD